MPKITTNKSGSVAYELSTKAALAQYVMTGALCQTMQGKKTTEDQTLTKVIDLASKVDSSFIAKLAVYARQFGYMKDMPALLAAILATRDIKALERIFNKVIDNPKILRKFVKLIRSGKLGRKSLGTAPKRLIKNYFENLTDIQLFKANVGNDPTLQDIIKLTHPCPKDDSRNAMFGYLLGKLYDKNKLCPLVNSFEEFKSDMSLPIPNVPFEMLTALPLTDDNWKTIAMNATWRQTKMNLNTFLRHNCFNDSSIVDTIADRLKDVELIASSKVFPYELFSAYKNIENNIPKKIKKALEVAADVACFNISEIPGKVFVFVDVSGSMSSLVFGNGNSTITCNQVASLFASAILRKNQTAEVILFDTKLHDVKLDSKNSILENADIIGKFGGGGTACALPFAHLNKTNAKGSTIIFISDNESNMDPNNYRCTEVIKQWNVFKKRNSGAKLINIDINPNHTTQSIDRDVLNIGGFSDNIFNVIHQFIISDNSDDYWVNAIEGFVKKDI